MFLGLWVGVFFGFLVGCYFDCLGFENGDWVGVLWGLVGGGSDESLVRIKGRVE